ncbi:MAG: SsrA-binding protein SmpB [Anaerolineales bacterium]|nr:MAG: SsrA-binding protein SmpB [Anaerolineales bacterium]
MSSDTIKTIATNRKARHDYFIDDSFEAGLVLSGTEIKSIRGGRVNLRDSFAMIKEGELWLMNTHIAPYDHGAYANHEPRRPRKLLMHRREINRIAGKLQEKGFTLVPLRIYLKDNLAKVELGLARGKKQYDKRATLREKETRREIDRVVARRWKGR